MGMTQPDRQYEKVRLKLKDYVTSEVAAVLEGKIGSDKSQNFDAASLSPEDARKAFDRSGIEKEYTQSLAKDELQIGVNNRLQVQNAILGSLEKTFRMRHRRRLDIMIPAVSRSQGLTSDTGYITHVLGRLPQVEAL